MRFVVDALLPPGLARYLTSQGHLAEHVYDLDMAGSNDSAIWDYAVGVAAAIVTKDEDFAIRASVATKGPAIVWLRVGNTSNRALLNWFGSLLPRIEAELAAGERLVEVT
jgi:predicted nuclease of predicted toxin-antitoxin system